MCNKCGGLITEPNRPYLYAGKICNCEYTQIAPSMLFNNPNQHQKCECHQCTWLRANQFERSFIPSPVIIKKED